MEPASKRLNADAVVSVEMPPDVVWEVLLRVPARALCRGRAVCRSWRSLLSDPGFIKAYASRRPGLILALAANGDRVDMVDLLSGDVVQRIDVPVEDVSAPHGYPGPPYLFRSKNNVIRVIDPETCAFSTLPSDDLDKGPRWRCDYETWACYTVGVAASAGKRKVLCVVTRRDCKSWLVEQYCHVFTLGDDRYGRWRRRPSPPARVWFDSRIHDVVIQGVVYFLADQYDPNSPDPDMNHVASFDLNTEEWRPATLPGPPSIDTSDEDCIMILATLNGSLC
ncbi:putative F-box protein At1g47790 [Aegilops tauschii subsp. strangulata]|uniref:putative F-box protein At1g47790 n=1 Tax=Aegilops tauschii subsp. strangulata TaxID=200361 RepID=UPI00098A51C4|nr:putative F-box protein At1g47790 [Aegilops tauschii subsp. strangulata]